MTDAAITTTDQFAGFSRNELWRRAECFRAMSRGAETIAERNRLEKLASDYDVACDRMWMGATNVR